MPHLVMFDVDGTLVESNDFDTECFVAAVEEVLRVPVDTDWGCYRHATDWGILEQIISEHPLQGDPAALFRSVKERFLEHVSAYLAQNALAPIKGAPQFLERLLEHPEARVAFATGCWLESARMKLAAVGIDVTGIPMASCTDHFDRVEIMKLAEARCEGGRCQARTYFGDAPWDLRAARSLGYDFVLVGDRLDYERSVTDYSATDEILASLGL